MGWVWGIGAGWLALGGLFGVLIGRGIRLADRDPAESRTTEAALPNFVVDQTPPSPVGADPIPSPAAAPAQEHRRPERATGA